MAARGGFGYGRHRRRNRLAGCVVSLNTFVKDGSPCLARSNYEEQGSTANICPSSVMNFVAGAIDARCNLESSQPISADFHQPASRAPGGRARQSILSQSNRFNSLFNTPTIPLTNRPQICPQFIRVFKGGALISRDARQFRPGLVNSADWLGGRRGALVD